MSDRIIGISLFLGMGTCAVLAVGGLIIGPTFSDWAWRPFTGIALTFVAVALAVVVVEIFRLERGRR